MGKKPRRHPGGDKSIKSPPIPTKLGWAQRAWLVSGWLVAAVLMLLDLPAKINSFSTEAPKAIDVVGRLIWNDADFQGTWASEGLADSEEYGMRLEGEAGHVTLSLDASRGVLAGAIDTWGLRENYIVSQVTLKGRVDDGVAYLTAYDIVGGATRCSRTSSWCPRTGRV